MKAKIYFTKIAKATLEVLKVLYGLLMTLLRKVKPAVIGLVQRPGNRLGPESPTPQMDALEKLALAPNWAVGSGRRMPHYLIKGHGKSIEKVTEQLLEQVHSERKALNVSVGKVAEATSTAGAVQALRFVHEFGPGQLCATDAILRAEGPDLYLRLESKPRTVLRYLQYGCYGVVFCTALLVLMFLYFIAFGAWRGWVVEYAQKYAASEHLNEQDKAAFFERKLLNGYYETNWCAFREKYQSDQDLLNRTAENITRFQIVTNAMGDKKITVHGDKTAYPSAYGCLFLEEGMTLQAIVGATMSFRVGGIKFGMGMDIYRALIGGGERDYDENFVKEFGPPSIKGAMMAIEALPVSYISSQNDDLCFASYVIGGNIGLGDMRELHTTQIIDPDFFDLPLSILVTERQSPEEKKAQKRLFAYFRDNTEHHGAIGFIGLFRKDPRMGMMHLGLPVGIMAAIIGFFVWKMPGSWLRFPCLWLGWMTPDDFETSVEAKNGWLERCLLVDVLQNGFEVDRSDIIDLRN